MAAVEDAALAKLMNLLQTEPEPSSGPEGGLVPTAPGHDIPALREQLAVLVSTGKAKEAIGVQLTHKQVKRLSYKDVEKYTKRYTQQNFLNAHFRASRPKYRPSLH